MVIEDIEEIDLANYWGKWKNQAFSKSGVSLLSEASFDKESEALQAAKAIEHKLRHGLSAGIFNSSGRIRQKDYAYSIQIPAKQ
jgi:hypothetical protein